MSVTVDEHFVRCGAKSYAINKITSIEVREVRPKETGNIVGFSVLAVLIVICGLSLLPNATGTLLIIVGLICGVAAVAAFGRAQHVRFILVLMTSSSETEASASYDADEVLSLRHQIESAIAGR